MPSPFPGMDPYLEDPELWPDFHGSFITLMKFALARQLPEGFVALSEKRVYLGAPRRDVIPDVMVFATAPARRPEPETGRGGVAILDATERVDEPEVVEAIEYREPRLQIFDRREAERRLVTVIELLSPTNKTTRHEGQRAYIRKREELLAANVNLLEIDLLRAGEHTVYVSAEEVLAYGSFDYLLTLRAMASPARRQFWRVGLRNHLPALHLPLTEDVPPVRLDVQEVFNQCYDNSAYSNLLNYAAEPVPPLDPDDAAWADTLLREKGLR